MRAQILTVLFLTTSTIATGCDVEEETEDGGVGGEADGGGGEGGEGGEGGGGGGGGGGGVGGGAGGGEPCTIDDDLNFVIIQDTTAANMVNDKGSPGVDICGITVECDGTELNASEATLTPGSGNFCKAGMTVPTNEGGTESCSADRDDESAAIGASEAMCGIAPVENQSQYVAIGVGGKLALKVTRDGGLKGCTLIVNELAGGTEAESYEVRICADADGTRCHPAGDPLVADGGEGEQSFDIPATCTP
jgi:hypothetical protein